MQLGRLKNDFLRMIAHEVRTPANGLFGFSELAFDLCEPTEEAVLYRKHYDSSKSRLLNLIDDSDLIAQLTDCQTTVGSLVSLSSILTGLRLRLPKTSILVEGQAEALSVSVYEEQGLLLRALETVVLLVDAFSAKKGEARLVARLDSGLLILRAQLDALQVANSGASGFFEIESVARSSSFAEPLGLAPVVAQRILYALGGDLRLIKEEERNGYLEAILCAEPLCVAGCP